MRDGRGIRKGVAIDSVRKRIRIAEKILVPERIAGEGWQAGIANRRPYTGFSFFVNSMVALSCR